MLKKWFKTNVAAPIETARRRMQIGNVPDAGTNARELPLDWAERSTPAAGVLPRNQRLALDSQMSTLRQALPLSVDDDLQFLGYGELAVLGQRSEYRLIIETYAREMTRKWIRVITTGDDDKAERIAELEQKLSDYNVRAIVREALEKDGQFGRAHVYVESKKRGANELQTPLALIPEKISKGDIVRFRVIEPFWTYPADVNTARPLDDDFFKPESWYIMGDTVHRSRLLTVVGREVSNIMKPVYMYGGVSLIQLAKPYVDNWLRTRQSVSDITHNFSVTGIKTDMDAALFEGAMEQYKKRADLFNTTRDNRGLMIMDTEEEFFSTATPLSGLDKLQAQAQEHMSSVAGIPLIILLGVTPSGLNASAESELDVWAQRVKSEQEKTVRPLLRTLLDIIQLNEYGELDPTIDFEFLPLRELTELEKAQVRSTDGATEVAYIGAGVLDPDDVRTRLAHTDESLYNGIDLSTPVEQPEPDDEETDDFAEDGDKWITVKPNGPSGKFGTGSGETAGPKRPDPAPTNVGPGETQNPSAIKFTSKPGDRFKHFTVHESSWPVGKVNVRNNITGEIWGTNLDPNDAEAMREFEDWDNAITQHHAEKLARTPHPKNPLEGLSTGHLPQKHEVSQPVNSWEGLEAKGVEAHAQFSQMLNSIGLDTSISNPDDITPETKGSRLLIAPNKSKTRSAEKVNADCGGDYSKLADYVRATITVDSYDDIGEAIARAQKAGIKFACQPTDKVTNPSKAGYRDVNTTVLLPNGMLAELQFNTNAMIAAKNVGHTWYEAQQRLERKNGNAPVTDWDVRDQKEYPALGAKQLRVYGEAYAQSS